MDRDKAKAKHPAGKYGKKDIETAVAYLHSIGRCGSKSKTNALCSLRENHSGEHQAQQLGGPLDGAIYSAWSW